MDIVNLRTSDLVPFVNNPRKQTEKTIQKVAESIKAFGFKQPIVINSENVVIVGHTRLLAAKKLNLETVPCLVASDLNAEDQARYRLLDNRLNELASWDEEALLVELDALSSDKFIAELFSKELAMLGEEKALAFDEEESDDTPTTPCTSVGEVWKIGRHTLFCNDSRDPSIMAALKGKAKLIVTDPPYGVEYEPEWREKLKQSKNTAKGKVLNDDIADWSDILVNLDADVIYHWCSSLFIDRIVPPIRSAGYDLRSIIIWGKDQFQISRGHYHWQYEPLLYFVRGNGHWQGRRDEGNLWSIPTNSAMNPDKEKTYGHGTQKPVECMARPIRNNSREGDTVIDPFLGSGTTMVACELLKRTCIAVELSPEYCTAILQRMFDQFGIIGVEENTGKKFQP